MRPLLDILTDEKSLMEEIKAVNDALAKPERKGEVDTLNEYLDHLYLRLSKARKEIRAYFNRIQN